MPLKSRKMVLWSVVGSLAVISQACLVAGKPSTDARPSPTATDAPPVNTAAPTARQNDLPASLTVPTRTPVPTPVAPAVSISAVGGDLAIRTGPDAAFDAVDVLKDGKSLPVYARSIQDGWLEVPIPSQRGQLGWISSRTSYSKVDGYVLDLPMISTVEWPFGAYLRNCTSHQVVAEPGDKPVPAVSEAPNNRVWFYPGLYTLYDADAAGRPEIMQVKLWPHTEVNLLKDGTGQKYSCP